MGNLGEINTLRDEYNELKAEYEAQKKEIASLEKKVVVLEAENKTWEEDHKALDLDNDKLREKVTSLEESVTELQHDGREKQDTIEEQDENWTNLVDLYERHRVKTRSFIKLSERLQQPDVVEATRNDYNTRREEVTETLDEMKDYIEDNS